MFARFVRWALVLVCWSLVPITSWSQSRAPLVLDTLIAELNAKNPSLQAQRWRTDALKQEIRQVTALPDPMVSVFYQPYPIWTARGTQRSQWRAEQTLPYPGKRRLAGRYAEQTAQVAALETEILGNDLVLQLKTAYYVLYQADAQDRLVEGFQEQLRAFEEAATVKYEVGQGTQQAILKAQLERNRFSMQRQRLQEARGTAVQTIARLLNRSDTTGLSGAVVLPDTRPFEVAGQVVERAMQRRPEVGVIQVQQAQATTQIERAELAFRPDFMVQVAYFDIAPQAALPMGTGRDAFGVGVGVKVPLWRERLRAGVAQARATQQHAAAHYDALEASIRTEIADLVQRLGRQQEQLTLLDETLLPQAEITLEATLSAYTTGRTDFLNLLDAERMLFDLQWDRIDTHVRLLHTTALLERAIGTSSR